MNEFRAQFHRPFLHREKVCHSSGKTRKFGQESNFGRSVKLKVAMAPSQRVEQFISTRQHPHGSLFERKTTGKEMDSEGGFLQDF